MTLRKSHGGDEVLHEAAEYEPRSMVGAITRVTLDSDLPVLTRM